MSTSTATAVVYEGPRVFTMKEIPLPAIGPQDTLLEVVLCGVDGSELHMYNGDYDWLNDKAPVTFGDEIIGRVIDIGVAAKERHGVVIGDLVTVEARWPCATGCQNCDRGQYFLCMHNTTFRGYGTISLAEPPHLWGGYATHVFVPEGALLYKVPQELPLRTALFACSVLANGLRWSEVNGAGAGKTTVVIGPGPQGLACTIAAARMGSTVVVVGLEHDGERLALARTLGAEHTYAIPEGEKPVETARKIRALVGRVDGVIEGAGYTPARDLAFEVISPLGVVTLVAAPTPPVQEINWRKVREVTINSPLSHPHTIARSFDFAVQLLEEGMDVGSLVTHEYSLKDAEKAIAVASYKTDERPIKVVLNPAL